MIKIELEFTSPYTRPVRFSERYKIVSIKNEDDIFSYIEKYNESINPRENRISDFRIIEN